MSPARWSVPRSPIDGVVAQTLVTFNFGKNGWNDLPDTADALRNIAQIDGVTVNIAGQGGQARRLGRGVRRHRRDTAVREPWAWSS